MNEVSITTRKGLMKDGKFIIPCEEFIDIEPAIVDGEKSDEIFIGTYPNDEKTYIKITDEGRYMKMSCTFSIFTDFENRASVVGICDERFGYKYGLINDKLTLKLGIEFDSIVALSEQFYKIQKKGLQGIYDFYNDKIIIEPEFEDIKYDKDKNLFSLIY